MPDLPLSGSKSGDWLVQEWAGAIARVIESMTGVSPQVDVRPAERPSGDDLFWWEQTFNAAEGATAWAGASTATWKEIGSSVLKAAGVDDDDEAGFKSTYQEVISQSFSSLAQSLSARLKREVICPSSREAAPGPGAGTYQIDLKLGEHSVSLAAVLSGQLTNALEEPTVKPDDRAAPASAPKANLDASPFPKSLDLLLDVELPVSVSFGRAQLPLKDVIKLTTGSIVELNRAVSEPVEIIVNNCVIARGQVVVVEGNFGVRIQQVVSRQDRLRTLR